MLHLLLCISCSQHTVKVDPPPSEPETEPTVTEPNRPPIDQLKLKERSNILLTTGVVEDLKATYSTTPIEINYIRQYPNGCFEQQEPTHTVSNLTLTHEITVVDHSESGAMCTMAIVPGGFSYQAKDLQPGQYTGEIFLNGELQLQYRFGIE